MPSLHHARTPAAVLLGAGLLVGLGADAVHGAVGADTAHRGQGPRLCATHGSYSPLTREAVRTYRTHERLRPTGLVCMSEQRALRSRRSVAAERASRSEARASRDAPIGVASLNWAALAECESGGDPHAVSASGYHGLYQFDTQTWQALGGSGAASDASASEQTRRAQQLYLEQGDDPWPNCGELLGS